MPAGVLALLPKACGRMAGISLQSNAELLAVCIRVDGWWRVLWDAGLWVAGGDGKDELCSFKSNFIMEKIILVQVWLK